MVRMVAVFCPALVSLLARQFFLLICVEMTTKVPRHPHLDGRPVAAVAAVGRTHAPDSGEAREGREAQKEPEACEAACGGVAPRWGSALVGRVILGVQAETHESVSRLILLAFAFFGDRPRRQLLPKPQPNPDIVLQSGARFPRQMIEFEVFRVIHSEAHLAFVEGVHGDSHYHADRTPTWHTRSSGSGSIRRSGAATVRCCGRATLFSVNTTFPAQPPTRP